MKSLKIWSLVAMLFFGLTSCETPDNGGTGNGGGNSVVKDIVDEWALVSWSDTDPVFNVYVDFNEDGTFDIYQQVYSLNYEYYGGSYALAGDVLSGEYADGTAWATTYTVSVSEDRSQLTMTSQESVGVTSVYFKESIPEEIKEEAAQTRAQLVEERLF